MFRRILLVIIFAIGALVVFGGVPECFAKEALYWQDAGGRGWRSVFYAPGNA